MAWPNSGPGRPRTLAPVERLRSDIQRITYHYLHGVPDGVHPDARDIAAHVSHVVIDDAQADWAATRLGLKDRERVRAALAGAMVSASQLRHAELIVEAFEVQGIAARVGDGWELCERAEARENERLIREREEQDAKDIADAIDWLEENWSTITDKGHWILAYCETVQREFPPPHNVRRGLQLLGGPDDAVVLGDLYEVEKLTEEQRTRADNQYDAIHEERHERLADEKRRNQEQSARLAAEEEQERQRQEQERQQRAVAAEAESKKLACEMEQQKKEREQREKEEARRNYIASAAQHLRKSEEELENYAAQVETAKSKAAAADDEAKRLETEVERLKAAGRKTNRVGDKAKSAREAAEDAAIDVQRLEDWVKVIRAEAQKHRAELQARERGMKAAAEARAAGKAEPEVQAAGVAAYEAALAVAELA